MLTFDPVGHRYFWNGQPVPNVTLILDEVTDFSRVNSEVMQIAKERGTAVHIACELDDKGDLVEESIHPIIVPYLDAYRKFKVECGPKWDSIEERVFHKTHQVAGTLDRRGYVCGSRCILDIKSGSEHPAVALQTSAYLESWCSESGETPRGWKRFALYLRDDRTYRLDEVKSPHVADFRDFLCALGVYRWKQKHNLIH